MTDEEINFEELQEIVNSPLKNKRTIKDFVKTIFDLSNKNKQLEKENAEQKEQIERLTKENDILIKGLGCETCSITDEYLKLNNTIRELEEQIEKLKCCGNCKNVCYEWGEIVIDGVCTKCEKYNKWEMRK